MLKLPKPVVIAIQATVGVALSAPWAVTALAKAAPANTATQSQTTPLLRGGDLVRLRSGGPALTVKSIHGNWVVCTWWHEGFGAFRTAGFPVAMVDGPITLPPVEVSPQTDVSPQTNQQMSPTERSDRPSGNLSDAGQTNQSPTAQGTNQTIDVGQKRPANARTSMSPRTRPAPALPLQQGTGQTNQNPTAQGTNQTIDVDRPALVLPQGTVQTVIPLQQGTIGVGQVRPALVLPQGTVQTVLPLQQGAGTNQTIGVGQMGPANARTSMSPQRVIGTRF
jgi:uncharacterized protein YodC (DUF2158 family)